MTNNLDYDEVKAAGCWKEQVQNILIRPHQAADELLISNTIFCLEGISDI